MQRITTPSQLDDVLQAEQALLFKHSTRCSISSWVKRNVTAFAQENPGTPVYLLHVVEDRPLSQLVARQTGIRHESPQALLIKSGKVVSSASHFDVDTVLDQAAGAVA